jgi:O-antigen ligase/polysaccharide polymerase Wzy-like membrane protein
MQGNPALAPGLLAIVLFLVFGGSEAGFYPSMWLAGALIVLALLVATAVAVGIPRGAPRAVLVALGLLAAYTAWTYLSITWAQQKGVALDGANRTALYLLVLALFSLWPWNPRGARLLLGTLGLGLALIGLVELIKADGAAQPLGYFIDVRFAQPAGYINANVALWTLGLFPCLYMASAREVHPVARGGFLGAAGLLSALALMGQSRGWVLALPLAVVLFVVLGSGRIRELAATVAVTLGTVAVAGPVMAVHDDFSPARIDTLLGDATRAILLMAAALALAGVAGAYAERRMSLTPGQLKGIRRGTAGTAALAVVIGAIAFVAAFGSPFTKASETWDKFKGGEAETGQANVGASRFTTVGTNRYDVWRVALDLFKERPVGGVGVDNLQPYYLRRGTSGERPRFAHSFELGVMAQTGLVGALLILGAFAAALVAAAGPLRRGYPPVSAACGAALAVFAYWFLHGSVDWFWEFPGLAAPAMAMLGLAAALGPRERSGYWPAPTPVVAGLAAAAGLMAVLFAGPWLAELEMDRASKNWPTGPEAALQRLDRARRLNPLSPKPDLVAGTIALRLGRVRDAESRFLRARERERDNTYALLELGLIAAERDDRGRATALLRKVIALNPTDDISKQVLVDIRRGRYVTSERVNRLLLRRAQGRVK